MPAQRRQLSADRKNLRQLHAPLRVHGLARCNSGVGIRTAKAGWPSGDGFELQILDAPGLTSDSTMAIYRNVEPLARADRSEEWNVS